MKIPHFIKYNRGMTLLELFVVLAVIFIVAMVLLPQMAGGHSAPRIQCVNNLKEIDFASRIWAASNGNKYPWATSETRGGSLEFASGPNAFRHFQVISNELATPRQVLCPADTGDRYLATNFTDFNNSNISFFISIQACETNPQMILAGDHNITNGISIRNGLLALITNTPAGWTAEMHNKVGNIALADGSVQQLSISGLRQIVSGSGSATNLIQMPILAP